jgi:hypothetical protein
MPESVSPLTATSSVSPAGGPPDQAKSRAVSAHEVTVDEQAAITQLAATDRHVRAHEQAHLAAAGPYAISGASYTMVTGPDGRQYAVGGEVSLDTSPVSGDPEATIEKARVIEAAANAPSDPSSQDRAVAAAAAAMKQTAQQELTKQHQASQVQAAYSPNREVIRSLSLSV